MYESLFHIRVQWRMYVYDKLYVKLRQFVISDHDIKVNLYGGNVRQSMGI